MALRVSTGCKPHTMYVCDCTRVTYMYILDAYALGFFIPGGGCQFNLPHVPHKIMVSRYIPRMAFGIVCLLDKDDAC